MNKKQYDRDYYLKNIDKIKKRKSKYYQKNKEFDRELKNWRNRRYYANNKAQLKEKREIKKEKSNAYAKDYHQKNKEEIKLKKYLYYTENVSKVDAIERNWNEKRKSIIGEL